MPSLVGSEMCIRDRVSTQSTWAGQVGKFITRQAPFGHRLTERFCSSHDFREGRNRFFLFQCFLLTGQSANLGSEYIPKSAKRMRINEQFGHQFVVRRHEVVDYLYPQASGGHWNFCTMLAQRFYNPAEQFIVADRSDTQRIPIHIRRQACVFPQSGQQLRPFDLTQRFLGTVNARWNGAGLTNSERERCATRFFFLQEVPNSISHNFCNTTAQKHEATPCTLR
eukprot:TRINITY_DN4363_c0_g1_i2.p1 TRINITY_DN4363_c0_g1~~TRINITY_DN4363_c0_g1_i2.p1  ORF type:complete len:224 (+),score=-15.80 TRINITY_DN4363_c0_g1_i2:104-775(+)